MTCFGVYCNLHIIWLSLKCYTYTFRNTPKKRILDTVNFTEKKSYSKPTWFCVEKDIFHSIVNLSLENKVCNLELKCRNKLTIQPLTVLLPSMHWSSGFTIKAQRVLDSCPKTQVLMHYAMWQWSVRLLNHWWEREWLSLSQVYSPDFFFRPIFWNVSL